MSRLLILIFSFIFFPFKSFSQINYEIQVYASEIAAEKETIIEFHNNYTLDGSKTTNSEVVATHHLINQSIEVTHGFKEWLEIGMYIYLNIVNGDYYLGGTDLRPRIKAPDKWKLPVGLSLSTEISYTRPLFSVDKIGWEIRPIIDKKWKCIYLSFNPVFDKSVKGLNDNKGFEFVPSFKISGYIKKEISAGIEYYSNLGYINDFLEYQQQFHQLFFVVDLESVKNLELNFGYGIATTKATDNGVFKIIVGYHFKNLHPENKTVRN